jgi:phosphatidylserine/phosphatidylglycerophosphate/cardiolipin synthase-like enzyme
MNSNFEYIKKRIGEDPKLGERVILLQSTLRDHDKKNLLNLASLNSSSDQTNLLLIDGNSPSPEALLTPKNLNGLSHSNALWIKGPAAALIQDSYLQDLRAAFINSDKKDSIDSQTQRSETLEHFKINRDLYPAMGQTVVRITEANVDGKIKNVRNTIIDQIKKASKHIYMEQFFLYDSYIVDALILKKKLTPSLKIKILLNNNENLGFNGFPNTIFIQKMKDAGIEIRTRKSHAEKILFEEESHKKISSFDGKTLILGSTNLSPDSLEGNFRELGAVVYDSREAKRFEREFEMSWANKKDVQKMNIEDFRFKLGDSFLSKLWSTFINDFAGTILRSKDEIEKRY